MIIAKTSADIHFTVTFGNDDMAFSNCLILPTADGCRVRVEMFGGRKGRKIPNIEHAYDETVYVDRGVVQISFGDTGESRMVAGQCVYHVPAGRSYNLEVIEEYFLVRMFSAAISMPDDK